VRGRVFAALLRYWRTQRGLTQLDLALSARISTRHLSFMETGRSAPSREMVLRLGGTLNLPLRAQNALLAAAGLPEEFVELAPSDPLPKEVSAAVDRMAAQQEPFPLIVKDRHHDVIRSNAAARSVVAHFVLEPKQLKPPLNVFRLLFHPRLSRPFVLDWHRIARQLLTRLHRQVLERPDDDGLSALLSELKGYPGVTKELAAPDFSTASTPTFTLSLERDGRRASFLTTLTTFSALQNVTLEELSIESYFPLDEETVSTCKWLSSRARRRRG
jgi:transcriptional regulator with XRE-family HTH domain